MPHIHTKPGDYDTTASAFIIDTSGSENRIILHEHIFLKFYMQLGGHIEHNENVWEAMVREIKQESGYDISQLKVLQPKDRLPEMSGNMTQHPIPIYIASHKFIGKEEHPHTDTAWILSVNEPPIHKLDKSESHIFHRLSLSELRAMSPSKILDTVRQTSIYALSLAVKDFDSVDASQFRVELKD